ncbi:beta-ketoacyl synthase domain-containing protein [Apiospora hydei]|uniref:Beta-ketoacyl synthase domain-containing protein n=1 Tax=Apiospora hydei TaxID=1337664 RepID=A0ABR1UVU5_9PEZI
MAASTSTSSFPFGATPAETPGETPYGQTPGESPFAGSPPSSATSVSAADSDDMTPTATDPSAIVGLAFRLPGAKSIPQLWDNVVTKKDLQKKMPEDRFNVDAFYHPQGTNKGTVSLIILHNRAGSLTT